MFINYLISHNVLFPSDELYLNIFGLFNEAVSISDRAVLGYGKRRNVHPILRNNAVHVTSRFRLCVHEILAFLGYLTALISIYRLFGSTIFKDQATHAKLFLICFTLEGETGTLNRNVRFFQSAPWNIAEDLRSQRPSICRKGLL